MWWAEVEGDSLMTESREDGECGDGGGGCGWGVAQLEGLDGWVGVQQVKQAGVGGEQEGLTLQLLGDVILVPNAIYCECNIESLYDIGPVQCIVSQQCWYWWPGAVAPGHQ